MKAAACLGPRRGQSASAWCAEALQERFPGGSQVELLGAGTCRRCRILRAASDHGFVLCSEDDDFHRLVAARRDRPKLVHLALGNASNDEGLTALLSSAERMASALVDPGVGVAVVERTRPSPTPSILGTGLQRRPGSDDARCPARMASSAFASPSERLATAMSSSAGVVHHRPGTTSSVRSDRLRWQEELAVLLD